MKQQRYILPSILFVLLLFGIGLASAIAQKPQDNKAILKQAVLQENDFPKNPANYAFSADEVKAGDFHGDTSFITTPFQAEGFLDAYRISGWYPFALQNNVSAKEFSNGAFVSNIAYLFQNSTQATKAFEQQIEQFNSGQREAAAAGYTKGTQVLKNTKTEDVTYGNVQGKLIEIEYIEDNINLTVHYFVGVANNRLLFLMADGVSDPVTQDVFQALVKTLVNNQGNK